MTLHNRSRALADGGAELTIRLTAAEVDAIGLTEAEGLAEYLDTALMGLAALRSGHTVRGDRRELTADDLYVVIRDLHKHLLPMVGGIEAAAIRRHRELGGTTTQLGAAMDSPRSSAQRRREALDQPGPRQAEAARWESWASTPRQH